MTSRSERVVLPAFEVWVDDGRYVAGFVYPPANTDPGETLSKYHHQFAERCYFYLARPFAEGAPDANFGPVPYAWNDYVAARWSAGRIRELGFPEAHVRKFDGKKRRRIRWRGIARSHGETS